MSIRFENRVFWFAFGRAGPLYVDTWKQSRFLLVSSVVKSGKESQHTVPQSVSLENLTALKGLARLERLPTFYGSDLDAHHVLIAILGLEVAHALRLLNPGVPDHAVLEVVADDVEGGLAVLHDGGRVLWNFLVDTIDFAGNGQAGCRLLVFGRIEDLVDVCHAAEAIDLDLGDILHRCQPPLFSLLVSI